MPTTAPTFAETDADPANRSLELPRELPDRVHLLEGEVAELRETIARFAELVIGEVKDLRKSHAELPVLPSAVAGELSYAKSGYAGSAVAASTEPSLLHRPWLLMELLRDFGMTFRMYLDPRYRVRRATQLLVPLIVLLFAFNCFFFRTVFQVPILDSVLEKAVDVILSILLYKVISREIVRYRQVIGQLLTWQEFSGKNHRVAIVSAEPAMTRLETE